MSSGSITSEDRRWQTTISDDILSIISDLLPLSDFINFRGVCRNWRSVPSCRSNITELSKRDPWCILYNFDARDKDMCLLYQCNNQRSCSVKLPGLRGAKCFASKHGWLFIRRNYDYLFFDPLTLEEIFLPKNPTKLFKSSARQVGTFSKSPTSQDCVVALLTSWDYSSIMVASCHVNADKWGTSLIKLNNPGVEHFELLPSPRYVYFKALKDVPLHANRVDRINRIFVCYDNHYLFFDFLREKYGIDRLPQNGLINKCYNKYFKSFNWYSKLKEVHSDNWICKFGKDFTFSFCLFNDCKVVDGKQVFGSQSCTIPNVPVIKAAWLYKDKLNSFEEDRGWQTTIPDNILSIISDLLPLSDFINFRGVCRKWRRAPSCRSNITELSKKDPWCILYDFDPQDKDMCLFYQCNNRKSCSVKLPGLRGAKCFVSKHGWLFIRRNNDYLFFDPLTLEEIFLPNYPDESFRSYACQVGTFSGSPSSQDCVVVLLSSMNPNTIEVASCHLAASKWVVSQFNADVNDHGVECESELLPNPRFIYFKAVKNPPRHVVGVDHINRIFICYDSHVLILHYKRNWFGIESLLNHVNIKKCYDKYFKSFNWYSKLKEVHSDDWICKFGKEYTFSFCLFNDCKSVEDRQVFGSHSCTIPNVPVIKAAWLYKDNLDLEVVKHNGFFPLFLFELMF